jgi:hypothetical protein|tara:strand:+ start:104 stop:370 length:267 start_codon:yes stop_codon:yes gene_type:complete
MGKKITLRETELISLIERVIKEHRLTEKKDWIQDVDKKIEKKGTEGKFHDWCIDNGFKDGCAKGCLDKGIAEGGIWAKRANFAKNTCK